MLNDKKYDYYHLVTGSDFFCCFSKQV